MNEKEVSAKLSKLNTDQLEEINQLIDKFLAAPKPNITENLAQIIKKFHIPKNYQLAIIEHSDDFSIEKAPVIIWNADGQFHILNVLDLSLLGQIDIPLSNIEKITYCNIGSYHPISKNMLNDEKFKEFKADFYKFARDYSECTYRGHTYRSDGCQDLLYIAGKYRVEFSPQSFGSLVRALNKPAVFMGNLHELTPCFDTDVFELITFHQYFVIDDEKYATQKNKLIHQYCDPLADINEIKKNIHLAFDKKMLTEQEANDYLQEYMNR